MNQTADMKVQGVLKMPCPSAGQRVFSLFLF